MPYTEVENKWENAIRSLGSRGAIIRERGIPRGDLNRRRNAMEGGDTEHVADHNHKGCRFSRYL